MADHGADEDLKSSSEERKKQMLKAKIVKSAKKKIEESEKVRAFATSCAASWTALGQQCTCSNGDANILQQPSAIVCGSWRTCKGVWGSPGHAQLLVFLR
jgi:hypothetical protein